MNNRPPTTDHRPREYYTLADLLARWERGEMPLEELVAHWPHDGITTDEQLQELVRGLVGLIWRVIELEVGES